MNILGVDVGSTMAKFVLIDKEKNICKQVMRKIQGNPKKCIEEIFYETSEFQNDVYIAVTGSSRAIIGEYLKANLIKSEILAHMYGVMQIEPAADLIFEIGGQDSKCIHINKGVISNFKMNSNCAAGTGAFIEAQARRLGLTLEELDSIALSAGNPRILNSKCAVFLESALINLQRNGVSGEDMAMTIFDSLARNYISSFGQNGIFEKAQKIVFVGGAAKFKAMKTAFEKNLNKEIVVLENCEYTGALGVALLLLEDILKKENNHLEENSLQNIFRVKQCQGCYNQCLLEGVESGDEFVYTGGICGRYQR